MVWTYPVPHPDCSLSGVGHDRGLPFHPDLDRFLFVSVSHPHPLARGRRQILFALDPVVKAHYLPLVF